MSLFPLFGVAPKAAAGASNDDARMSAKRGSNQAITTATATKCQFDTETFDPKGDYDNATNYRYTPSVAGVYLVSITPTLTDVGDGKFAYGQIRKNGSTIMTGYKGNGMAIDTTVGGAFLVEMNGTTDYLEAFVYHNHGSNRNLSASGWLDIHRLGA
jgi:hypothetical protein